MLIITTATRTEAVHIGERITATNRQIASVQSVQADGHELDAVMKLYPHLIPNNGARVITVWGIGLTGMVSCVN